jgi:hypothetical protein
VTRYLPVWIRASKITALRAQLAGTMILDLSVWHPKATLGRASVASRSRIWGLLTSTSGLSHVRFDVMCLNDMHSSTSLTPDCVMSCAEDCLDRWTKEEAYCKAPADLIEQRCGYYLNFGNFTPRHRQAWSNACGIPWPCLNAQAP